ncbi:MAG: hypothetical protein ACK5B9_04765 [Flavobacteriia bacterium]|jgi:hypothetical protein
MEQQKEGIITYAIDYPESKDNFFLYHVLPKELKTSFKGDKMELKIQKAIMENTIIIDNKSKKIAAFNNFEGMFCSELDANDIQKIINKHPNYKITFTNEKDTLIGFNIKKAIAVDPKKPQEKIEIWYTEDIKLKNPNWFNGFDKIPGVMLKYSIVQYDLKMEFVAKKFEAVTISDSVVSLKRKGTKIPHSEYDKMIQDLFDSFK